jgi:hypothetical protein
METGVGEGQGEKRKDRSMDNTEEDGEPPQKR